MYRLWKISSDNDELFRVGGEQGKKENTARGKTLAHTRERDR